MQEMVHEPYASNCGRQYSWQDNTMMIVTSILLCLLAASVIGQDPPDTCRSQDTLSPEDERLVEELESGLISVPEARQRTTQPPPPTNIPCERGPVRVPHIVPFEFHIPTIFKRSCNNLPCRDPPCYAKRRALSVRCVRVYRFINGNWVSLGYRLVRFWEDVECECKACKHIRSRRECVNTYPCPNGNDTCSYCYWQLALSTLTPPDSEVTTRQLPTVSTISTISPVPQGRCACCTPTCCPAPQQFNYDRCRCECPRRPPNGCPPGQIFNDDSCECECPPGTTQAPNGLCIADCEDIRDLRTCRNFLCRDNPHFRCLRSGNSCTCPTCRNAGNNEGLCVRTNCTEQRTKPRCVYDADERCRCPICRDQTNVNLCHSTTCGPPTGSERLCRWSGLRCYCP